MRSPWPRREVLARILILGLGRVGLVTAVLLARAGHQVLAVDRDPAVRAAVAAGCPPFPEPGLAEALTALHPTGRLAVAAQLPPLEGIEAAFVCVGTPQAAAGGFDLGDLLGALEEIGCGLRHQDGRPRPLAVAVRSTLLPGTSETVLIPTLAAAAGTPCGRTFELLHLPEFLREGSALEDARAPARAVVGERRPGASAPLRALLATTGTVPQPVPLRLAEILKLADNAWHAVKVAFANELGRLAQTFGVDAEALARLFLADHRLNLSAAYLRPGGPFGGPCLGKDLAALLHHARAHGLELPLLAGVEVSNRRHLAWLEGQLRARVPPPGPVVLHGLAFKPGTGDLRDSPWLALARRLQAGGYGLVLFDPELAPAALPPDLAPLWRPPAAWPAAATVLTTREDAPPDWPTLDLHRLLRARDEPAPAPCRRSARPGDR